MYFNLINNVLYKSFKNSLVDVTQKERPTVLLYIPSASFHGKEKMFFLFV